MSNKGPVLILLAAAALACLPACARQSAPPLRTRVMVTGDADVRAQPDTAVVVVSVVTQSTRALEAQQANARKSEAVINAVKASAGANPEVRTSDYSLQPQHDWWGGKPRITGYEARNSVTVTMSELDRVGAVIDAATGAGANSVESVNFIVREANPARKETLAEATRQAMSKAEAIAQALGGRVVRVVEQQEGGFVNRPPTAEELATYGGYANANANTAMNMSASKAPPRTPVEAGSLNLKSHVQIIVEIETPH